MLCGEIGREDVKFIELDQDMFRWLASVMTVMNIDFHLEWNVLDHLNNLLNEEMLTQNVLKCLTCFFR